MHTVHWSPTSYDNAAERESSSSWTVPDGAFALPARRGQHAWRLVLLGRRGVCLGPQVVALEPGRPRELSGGTLLWTHATAAERMTKSDTQSENTGTRQRLLRLHAPDGPVDLRPEEIVLVGRSSLCQVRLEDPRVSLFHCALLLERDGVQVIDLESSNGTRLNGVRITHAFVNQPACLQVGQSSLRVEPPVVAPMGWVELHSPAMQNVERVLARVARADLPVTIVGESGTGKEGVARRLHELSGRRGDFVAINSATLTPELAGSELFGHVRGAFTGASSDRRGAFALAHEGTLFLDEIGELRTDVQAELLRVLEERRVRPVGGSASIAVDVRLVTATHRDLGGMVRSGAFREDLYHRVWVLPVRLPPLRERPDDLEHLAEAFVARQSPPRQLSEGAREALRRFPWPGNIRQLRNTLLRACALSDHETLTVSDLDLPIETVDERQRDILEAFRANHDRVGDTARALEVHRTTVYRALRRAGLR